MPHTGESGKKKSVVQTDHAWCLDISILTGLNLYDFNGSRTPRTLDPVIHKSNVPQSPYFPGWLIQHQFGLCKCIPQVCAILAYL